MHGLCSYHVHSGFKPRLIDVGAKRFLLENCIIRIKYLFSYSSLIRAAHAVSRSCFHPADQTRLHQDFLRILNTFYFARLDVPLQKVWCE